MKIAQLTPFIILLGLFIVLYILLIPPSDRASLLETSSNNDEERAVQQCIESCNKATIDLSKGPCLWENNVEDYVCDVAHSPRQDIDNDPSNQCTAYREGRASHFVEVDENCNLMRSM